MTDNNLEREWSGVPWEKRPEWVKQEVSHQEHEHTEHIKEVSQRRSRLKGDKT